MATAMPTTGQWGKNIRGHNLVVRRAVAGKAVVVTRRERTGDRPPIHAAHEALRLRPTGALLGAS